MNKITQTNRSICFLNSENARDAFFDRAPKMVRHRSMSGTSAAKMTTLLRLQLSDLVDERCDQVPFRALADMRRSEHVNDPCSFSL